MVLSGPILIVDKKGITVISFSKAFLNAKRGRLTE